MGYCAASLSGVLYDEWNKKVPELDHGMVCGKLVLNNLVYHYKFVSNKEEVSYTWILNHISLLS